MNQAYCRAQPQTISQLSELQIQPHLYQLGEGLDALWLIVHLLESRQDREATAMRAMLATVQRRMQNALNEVYECISL